MNGEVNGWIEKEFETIHFRSKRLERRFKVVMSDLSEQPEKSIWLASGSRANAKAVYRMIGNEKFSKEEILAAHRTATKGRNEEKVLLAVQDTMAVNYKEHEKTKGMGYNCEQVLGINVHSCLLLTTQGIPLGVVAQSVITREEPTDERSHYEKRIRPFKEKESYRWYQAMETAAQNAPENSRLIHIADREGDIYELYAGAERSGEKFIIRAIHNRTAQSGDKILEALHKSDKKGVIRMVIPANHEKRRKEREAEMSVRYERFEIKKPQIRKAEEQLEPTLSLNLISVREENPPEGEERIEWLLMTNLDIGSNEDVLKIVEYYRHRWKIERFHFVLKSACEIEKIQQRSVNGIELVILMYSIIALHIMQLTFVARNFPDTPCELIFSESEWKTLYRAANRTTIAPTEPYSMADAVKYVAKLGGFVGAPSDGHPGLKVIWLGLNALFILHAYRNFI
jgi:hypothetical protein